MDEFDKKVNEFLEIETEELINKMQDLSKQYPGDYRILAVAAAGSSMNFTKAMLRNYHNELLDYLQKRNL